MKKSRRSAQPPSLYRLPRIIGRVSFLDAIREAIADKKGRSRVLYFVGSGGIGKTRLLEEVPNIQKGFKGTPFLWSGIIDLYHEDNHSPDNLKEAIAKGVDPDKKYFVEFWKLREQMKEKRNQGAVGSGFIEMRKQLNDQFLEEYKSLALKKRLVLCFDTMELIQYESDDVQKICQVEDEDTVVKNWLLSQLDQMPNTVTIFAGRPSRKLEEDFERVFKNVKIDFSSYTLNAFTKSEIEEYLDEMYKIHPNLVDAIEPGARLLITELSQGRPIRLALFIDLIQAGGDAGFLSSPENIDKALIEKLLGYRKEEEEEAKSLKSPYRELIVFLALARKGLDQGLLRHLTGWSKKICSDNLKKITDLEIVKLRAGTEQLFFHDEIYDLIDNYFTDSPSGVGEIVAYYTNLLKSAKLEERQELSVKLLYYQFQLNANTGYHRYYARLDEDAIKGHEIGFDMRLRDEGLRFLDRYADELSPFHDRRVSAAISRDAINRDCAVRWVKRYIARGEYKTAYQVAKNARYSQADGFKWEDINDPLYKANLLTAWAEAMIYASFREEEARGKLEEAINLLTNLDGLDEYQNWWKERILGTAYNRLGYSHRLAGRYNSAIKNFKKALTFFSKEDMREERANVLNNMAYSSALLGRYENARTNVVDAIKIRENLDKKYPLALSYNTRGRIHILGDHPMWGEKDCRKALHIFEDLKDSRGIGLANIGIGLTLRKRGDQWKLAVYTHQQAEDFFKKSAIHFKKAIETFSKGALEPLQLWEANNELGSLYCDWGWLMKNQNKKDSMVLEQYQKSMNYQEEAYNIAKTHKLSFQIIDSLDDLAQIYADQSFLLHDMGSFKEARKSMNIASSYLNKISNLIPLQYYIKEGIGFSHAVTPEHGEAYWLALGKMSLQRGIWLFEKIKRGHKLSAIQRENSIREGIAHFALSTAYFQEYWPQSHAFHDGLNACAKRLQGIGVSVDFALHIVEVTEELFRVGLYPLSKAIEDVLVG